jgi:hypothetical protein
MNAFPAHGIRRHTSRKEPSTITGFAGRCFFIHGCVCMRVLNHLMSESDDDSYHVQPNRGPTTTVTSPYDCPEAIITASKCTYNLQEMSLQIVKLSTEIRELKEAFALFIRRENVSLANTNSRLEKECEQLKSALE